MRSHRLLLAVVPVLAVLAVAGPASAASITMSVADKPKSLKLLSTVKGVPQYRIAYGADLGLRFAGKLDSGAPAANTGFANYFYRYGTKQTENESSTLGADGTTVLRYIANVNTRLQPYLSAQTGIGAVTAGNIFDVYVYPTLNVNRAGRNLYGQVGSRTPKQDGTLEIQRKRGKRFKKVAKTKLLPNGDWTGKLPAKKGTYRLYFRAKSKANLLDAFSGTLKVR